MTEQAVVNTGGRRLRVVVEAPSPLSFPVKELLAMPGADVTFCGGPPSHLGLPCPVTVGCACWRAEDADVVVAALGMGDDCGRPIVLGLRQRYPKLPVVILAWRADVLAGRTDIEGCETVVFPWTTRKLHEAIRRASGSDVARTATSEPVSAAAKGQTP